MMKRILIALAALNLGLFSVTQAQVIVVNNSNATQLAQSLAGSGITVSNATKNCPNTGTGTFSNGNTTNLGITSGVVLTTGNTNNIAQAASNFSGVDNANGTDAQLAALVSPNPITDVCALEFDMAVQGNTVTFRYVFASEEYPEYVCSQFNDVFGFFVSGPAPGGGNYTNQNIAIIPGSNPQQNVAIGSVNPGVPGSGYTAGGCTSLGYSNLYINNGAATSVIYDGMTVTLTATISVIPCQTYHIKLAVADVSDGSWDSGVFLEASSFTSQPVTVATQYDLGFTSAFEGCTNGSFVINYPDLASSSTPITYTISGTGTNGVDYGTLSGTTYVNPGTSTATVYVNTIGDNLPEGTETVTITINDPCTGLPVGSATLNIVDPPLDTAYASQYFVCSPGDQVQLTATGGGTYSWSPPTGLSSTTSATPTATINGPITYTATIVLGNCVNTHSVDIGISGLTLAALDSADLVICPGTVATIGADADNGVAPITYQWSPPGQVSNPTSPIVTVTPTVTSTYNVTATDATGCSATADVTVTVDTLAQIRFGADVNLCPENAPYTLSVPGSPYTTYLWSNGATTATISVAVTDSFSVTVTRNNCTLVSDTIAVIYYQPVDPTLNDTGYCAGSSVTLSVADPTYTNIVWSTSATTTTINVSTPGTYYYTATDANGCSIASDTATVTEYLTPTANITASEDTLCPNETAVLYANAANATSYSWTGGSTADTLVVSAPGVYIVTASNPACSVQDTFEVFGFTNPNALIAADTTVCNGQSATFALQNGPFQTYTWSNGATGVTSITTNVPDTYTLTVFDGNCSWTSNSVTLANFPTPVPTLADTGACTGTPVVLGVEPGLVNIVWSDASTGTTVTVTADGTYYYTAEDVNGCDVASDTVSVTFLPAPTVNLTTDDDTICVGASTVLRANATGTALSYNWSPVAGTADTLVVTQAGTYYVTVSNGFCPVVDSVAVATFPYSPVLTNNDTTVCTGASVVVSLNGTYDTYAWSNGATTPTVTTSTPGNYWATVTSNGCTYTSDTFTLSNYPVTTAALADTGACTGQSVTLTAQPGLTNVVWSLGPNGPTLTVTGAGDYWYTATDANGCNVTSDTSTVTFAPAPTVNLTATSDTFCLGRTTTLNPNATGTNLTYVWGPNGETTSTITVSTAGTYTVTVSNGFCPTADTITVYQYTPVNVTVNADVTVCPGTAVTVAATGGPYQTYNWSNGPTTPTITVTAPGDYFVVVNDGNCTYASDTFTLSNFTVTTPQATPATTTVCNGTPVSLSGDAGYTGYLWSPGNLPGQTVTVNAAGTYSYTATDANGCSVTSTTATVNYTAPPSSTINPAAAVLCPGGSVTLYAPAEAGVTYTWTPGPVVGDSLVVTAAGAYTLTANVGTCQSSSTASVTSGTNPVFNVAGYTTSCCTEVALSSGLGAGNSYVWSDVNGVVSTSDTLYVQSTNNDTAYYSLTVTNADGCTATQANIGVRINCIRPSATASPDSVLAGQTSQLTVLTGYNDVTFNYTWTPGATLSDSTTSNPTASPLEETTYTVYVTDPINGCVDSATVSVFIQFGEKFKVPNAFSPNGDGRNDNFYPVLLGAYQSVTEFRIYNRWGALVHNSTDPWDGIFNGAMQPTGTFIYYLTVRVPDDANIGQTKDVKVTGSFTLLHQKLQKYK